LPVYNDPNIKNIANYQGLNELQYEIRDTNLISEDYFGIVEFPTKFTAGKNLFKLKAHPSNLVKESEIFIEILDFNGDPIYYEPLNYIQKDKARVIAVWIYKDTAPGPCQIYLAGRAAFNTQTQRNIPFSRNINSDNHVSIPNACRAYRKK